MSLILIEGFEDFSAGWVPSSSQVTIGAGRTGNGVITATVLTVSYTIPPAQESDTVTLGFAFKANGVGSGQTMIYLDSDGGTVTHFRLNVGSTGTVIAQRSVTTLATSAAGVLSANTWAYVEVQVKLHDTLGTVTVRVNGVVVIGPLTNQDTKQAGTKTTFDTVRVGGVVGANNWIDDLYLMTGAGDSFLGDCQVETLYPSGNGNANAWAGSDGDSTNNYLLVDEAAMDISDYVGSSTSGQQDMYAMGNPALRTGAILGVCHQSMVGRSDNTVTTFKQVNRRSADTKLTQTLQTVLAAYHYCLTTDPETGSAWTYAALDALQSGVEVS